MMTYGQGALALLLVSACGASNQTTDDAGMIQVVSHSNPYAAAAAEEAKKGDQLGNYPSGGGAAPGPTPNCDCSWTNGGTTCGTDDGSVCWGECCDKPLLSAPLGGSPPACDCSWANSGSCGGGWDGTPCWAVCCGNCDCSWANPDTCGGGDGTMCWTACCGGSPSPPPPPPGPTPPTPPTPSGGGTYCPSAGDFTVAYGDRVDLFDGGWTVHGNGGAATKAAFNLLGGEVTYDIDLSNVNTGVNANIYTISPSIGPGGYTTGNYCDGADQTAVWCLEVDWIESNGNCGGACTLHTVPGPGPDRCTSWGCRATFYYDYHPKFSMRVTYSADGVWKTYRDGTEITNFSPQPGAQAWSVIKSSYEQKGAVIYSSEWSGWVPLPSCGTSGDLDSSHFTISNLKITGTVVQGPTPSTC